MRMCDPSHRLRGDGGLSMTIIKHRSVLIGIALMALLVSTFAAGASPAGGPSATNPYCNTPVFFGLHGMGEGPSNTIPAVSPEIQGFDYEQNLISGAVYN